MAKREMNRKLLEEVRDWLRSGRPVAVEGGAVGRLHMGHVTHQESGAGVCGTSCCIAGAGIAMTKGMQFAKACRFLSGEKSNGEVFDYELEGAKAFGLTLRTARMLFNPELYVKGFYDDGWRLRHITNEWAAAVIDRLLETGEVDWAVAMPSKWWR